MVAPTPQAAAHYYPAAYWFSLIEVPDKSEFPGTGPPGACLDNVMIGQKRTRTS